MSAQAENTAPNADPNAGAPADGDGDGGGAPADGGGGKAPARDAKADGSADDGGSGDEGGEKAKSLLSDDGKSAADGAGDSEGGLEITVPDGVELDETLVAEFLPIAKEVGLDSESASKMVEWYAKFSEGIVAAEAEKLDKQNEVWADQLKADPDFGGDKFNATVENAKRAANHFAPELVAELESMGLGNYPPLFKLLSRVGAEMREDRGSGGAFGGKPANDPRADLENKARALFPKSLGGG